MEDDEFKFDKTAFDAMTFQEADNHYQVWRNKSPEERLNAAAFLINHAFGTSADTPLQDYIFIKET